MKMNKGMLKKVVGVCLGVMALIALLSGCGKQPSGAEAATDASLQAPFFTKGVYCSYAQGAEARDYFYVFYDEGAGYTEDGNNGIGLPFACEQKDNKVVFSFGGIEEESRQELVVKSAEKGIVIGEFDEDGTELVFELLSDADPDNFNGMEYIGKSGGTGETVQDEAKGSGALSESQALDAAINYYKTVNPGYENGKEANDYWDVSTNDSGEIVVLYHSSTGAINRYYVDVNSGETYVTELVPGIIDDEQKTGEAFNIRDYL